MTDPAQGPAPAATAAKANAKGDTWTTRRLVAWIIDAFGKADVQPARLCAELLVAHVLRCDRMALVIDADRAASVHERAALRDLVARALRHEPVQYLVGRWSFYGVELMVDRRALIPRPCTELLVDIALEHLRAQGDAGGSTDRPALVADVCTGSACVALAVAKHRPGATIIASDIDADALALAAENLALARVEQRVKLAQGPGLEPLQQHADAFDVLLSNPPYIPDGEWESVEQRVRDYEPHLALRGGRDGLDVAGPIARGMLALLRPGGLGVIELASSSVATVAESLREHPLAQSVQTRRDQQGLDRFVLVRRRAAGSTEP